MEVVIDWELTVTLLTMLACVGSYHVATGGAWRSTEHGRHVMAFTAAAAILVAVPLLMAATGLQPGGPVWLTVARLVGYTAVLPVAPWRLWLILTAGDPSLAFPRGRRAWHLPRKDS